MKSSLEEVNAVIKSRRLYLMFLMWTFISATLASATTDQRFSTEQGNEIHEICNGEVFQPRCHGDDVIVMLTARYGRMRIGRCVKEEPALVSIMKDPRYLGCSTDVLHAVSRHCSGKSECTIRVNDQNFDNVEPCYDSLKMYLETTYVCLSVAAETRYCTVSVSSGPQHIVDFGRTRQHSETLGSRCGDESRPWTVDALNGQRIVVSLIDFTDLNYTIEAQHNAGRCGVMYGDVIDKAARKNVSICRRAEQDGGLSRVYVSQSNLLHIVFTPAASPQQQQQRNFIIHVEAVGCSDLVSPSDGAWLRRDGDDVIVGCYTSRQSWQLRCVDGVWTGTVGLCPQQHQYHSQQQLTRSDAAVVSGKEQQRSIHSRNDNFALLSIVAVSCSGVALCLVVICVGVACLRRQKRQMKREKSAADIERLKPMNGSIDSYSMNMSATNDDVNLQWHQQQRQQLVM